MIEYVPVDGVQIACQIEGNSDAPALVFSNSIGTNMHLWDAQAIALRSAFRIVRYDMRGHGQSDVPDEPATIERLERDLLAVLDHFEIERAHICGISLGGMVALWVAAMHRERVHRAVFANTSARIGSIESWATRIKLVREGRMAAAREIGIKRFLSREFRERQPIVTDVIGDMLEATDPEGYIAACAALRDADLSVIVPIIRVPSLIISGELDESTPPIQSKQLHNAIAGSKLIIFPNTAHLSNIEQPEMFNACLLKFLSTT